MNNYFLCLVINLFRTFIIFRFMGIFFNRKHTRRKWEVFTYTLFYIMTVPLYLAFKQPIIYVFSNILGMFIITLVYPDKLKKKIVVVMLVYWINMLCEAIVVLAFTNHTIEKELNELVEIIAVLLVLMSELVVEKLVNKKTQAATLPTHLIFLIIIPLSSVIFLYVLMIKTVSYRYVLVFLSLGFLIINMTGFYLYITIVNSYSQKVEKDLLEQKLKTYTNQLDVIMQSQEKIRSLQHDMKHHMMELKGMALESNNAQMIVYLGKMKNFMDNPAEYIYSGHKEIDSVLNYMIQRAKNILIKVDAKIKIPHNLACHSFDLNVILGNLLENAIEAAKQTEEKKLNINLEWNKGVLFIGIQNSYLSKPEIRVHEFITSKNKRERHGFGLANVKRIVEMYNGTIAIYQKEKMFNVDIILYMSNIEQDISSKKDGT